MLNQIAVDYYPEHCDESLWPRDLRLMKENGIEAVRMFCFCWSRLEQGDENWNFDWTHRILRLLESEKMKAVLCTPTGAPPAWLTAKHPETLLVPRNGKRAKHGARKHYCPTSRVCRDYSNRIASKMFEELGGYPNVIAWQIDNELGFNPCWCGECEAAFRERMRERYQTLDRLNEAWGLAFWGREFYSWDEVGLPQSEFDGHEPHQEFQEFYSDQIIGFMNEQVATLRAKGCRTPITSNMMADFPMIDYWKMAESLDFIAWDNYFDLYTLPGNSLAHHLMRSLKNGKGYWTYENGVNSASPWLQPPPGFNIVHGVSALAHGEEGHTFFPWRTFPFAHEQDLQGLLDWGSRPRKALAEVKALREILTELNRIDLPAISPRAAIVYSYPNYWGASYYYDKNYYARNSYRAYWPEVESFYHGLFDLGVGCDCVPPGADLSRYALVLTPGLCLVDDGHIDGFRDHVERGGVLVTGRKSFAKTPHNSYWTCDHPTRLTDVFGLRVAETQSAEDGNDLNVRSAAGERPHRSWRLRGESGLPDTVSDGWFEVLELGTAQPLYRYSDGYFPSQPAAAVNAFGAGHAFYLGTRIERSAMKAFMKLVLQKAGIEPCVEVPFGAQVVRRGDFWVATNHSTESVTIRFPDEVVPVAGVEPQSAVLELPGCSWSVVRQKAAR